MYFISAVFSFMFNASKLSKLNLTTDDTKLLNLFHSMCLSYFPGCSYVLGQMMYNSTTYLKSPT